MRILMMGTGPFAVPSFEALVSSHHEVVALVTRPAAGSHRRKRKDINPMRESAVGFGLPVLDPDNVNDPGFASTIASFQADLLVVCDYGQILSKAVLSIPRLGGINLHGSLLPRYRGAAPINWAIYNGDLETGNTVILMTPKLDGGPILGTVTMPLEADDTAVTVEEKLSRLGVQLVLDSIQQLENWDGESALGEIQDQAKSSKAPRLSKNDGVIDWSRNAIELVHQVQAFQPWPGSYTNLLRQGQSPQRLILTKVAACSIPMEEALTNDQIRPAPGTIVEVDKSSIGVQTLESTLKILMLQPSGKKVMATGDFLRGNPVVVGDRFEDLPGN
ncbi:MAG: methionyl-tRNA formyltransferase [Pirellulaceae bacterium]|nr:methionyl-tRNA formyltransferase [Pirellulaceae bacterium]